MAGTLTANSTIVTSILSSVLPPILVKAASLAQDQYDICYNIKTEILYLQSTLNEVNEILEEAEERQIDNTTVRGLLRHLVDIAYEARDELDDFITSASTISTRSTSRSVLFNNCLPISFFLSWFDDRWSSIVQVVLPFRVRCRVAWNIRSIRSRLADVMKQRDIVDISQYVSERKKRAESVSKIVRPESSYLTDNQSDLLVGREDVKEDIMEKLLDKNNNHVQLVAIWGMGGVGKTTLAQHICNDDRVNCYHKRWFHVGGKLNCKEIISKILDPSGSIDVMQRQVVEKLKGFTVESLDDENLKNRRFLIVLDDVWEVDSGEWNLLWNPLTHVGNGGMIIITTRIGNVITASNTQVQRNLLPLSDDDCWRIFESHAFVGGKSDNKPDLKCIGQEIVKKLQGLPLAAKVVGRSLFNEPNEKIWEDFLHAREWKLRKKDDDVMPALRWSYKRLPPHLKQCFAYCALFPKDHEFNEKVLVEMWMAHDLIQINGDGRRPEDIGSLYFKELTYASLFQCVYETYVMHNMIHELALVVSNEEFSGEVGSLSTDKMEKVRHITIPTDNEYSNNLGLCKSKRILTVCTLHRWYVSTQPLVSKDILLEVFRQSKSLRVLVLSNKHISEIPECIIELKHLRYLDVKKTSVKSLPNSLCELHNLQMLAAPLDAILPRDIVNIRCLRYIRANVSTCRGIEKLTSLQELSSIHVSEGDNIRELGVMRQLQGKLKIKGLENISNSQEAAQALMNDKSNIEELELEFSRDLGTYSIVTDVLDALGCPPNLKGLRIVGYTGVEPPSWMVDGKIFTKLQTLELSNCYQFECQQLLGQMKSLEVLIIINCSKIKLLDFSCLPLLRRLFVLDCNELVSIYAPVAVERLWVSNCEKLKSESTNFLGLEHCEKLESLTILLCPLLESINEEERSTSSSCSTSRWSSLYVLDTDNEQVFRNFFHSNITNIEITRNSKLLECLGEIMKNSSHKLKSLGNLIISDYNQLQSLPTGCLPDSLDMLQLYHCPKLQSLPADDLPSSLRDLIIKGCPLLYERYNDESGPDRHKINHIPHKEICLLR